MSAATVVVDFQRTTAVQGGNATGQSGTTTMDDPDARAAAEADAGATSGSVKTLDDPEARPFATALPSSPSSSQWPESSSQTRGASNSNHGKRKRAATRNVALIAAGLGLAMVGIFTAGRAVRRPSVTAAPITVQAREQPAAPAVPPPLPPSVTVSKPTSSPGTAPEKGAAAEAAAASAPADSHEEKSKRGEHAHARRKAAKPADWATDPSGNPIPPM